MHIVYYRRWASFTLCYLLLVVVFGAFVRATGSGAGCGNHWPLCNGVLVPQSHGIKTFIEYTHRLTSALCLPLVVWVYYLSVCNFVKGSHVRLFAFWAIIFVVFEGLIGAMLVKLEHVADNSSVYRVLSLGGHLINTFLLTAMSTLAVGKNCGHSNKSISKELGSNVLLSVALIIILLISLTGAITALGDTLFPNIDIAHDSWRLWAHTGQHLFVRLRVYHPFLALLGSSYIIWAVCRIASNNDLAIKKTSGVIVGIIVVQMLFGYLNVYLRAPVWMQLVHLLIAQLLWVTMVDLWSLACGLKLSR